MHTRAQDKRVILSITLLAGASFAIPILRAQGATSLKPTGTTGQISGIIRDSSGQVVPGALVLISRTFPITGVAGARSFSVSTDSRGFYQIANLPPGSYKVCPSALGMQLLDPCLWSAKHPLSNLQGGQTATVNVSLQAGGYVHVRIDDANAKIAASQKARNAPAVHLNVTGLHGTPIHLDEIAQDSQGRNYWVLVPQGTDVPLRLDPGDLDIQRSDGSKVTVSDAPTTVRGTPPTAGFQGGTIQSGQSFAGAQSNTFIRYKVN